MVFLHLFIVLVFGGYEKICGRNYVGVGYDYLTSEFKFPIFTNTYNYSDPTHIWQNPFYPSKPEYIPQELIITNTPESFDLEGVMIHHILDNYTREVDYHYSDSGLFSKHTEDIYYFINRLLVYDNDQGFSYKRIAWYTLELDALLVFVPEKYFTPTFKNAMDALPEDLEGNHKYMYQLFLRTYGTNYVRRAVMGGELSMKAWLHDCFLQQKSVSWVHEQSMFSFLGIINFGHTREKYLKQVDATFLEHVEMNMFTKGGVWINGSSWEQYKLSLKGQLLQPIYYTLNSITDLFMDPVKKTNMETVIKEYETEQTNILQDLIVKTEHEQKMPKPNWCKEIPKPWTIRKKKGEEEEN